jgi:hypothetical protein
MGHGILMQGAQCVPACPEQDLKHRTNGDDLWCSVEARQHAGCRQGGKIKLADGRGATH